MPRAARRVRQVFDNIAKCFANLNVTPCSHCGITHLNGGYAKMAHLSAFNRTMMMTGLSGKHIVLGISGGIAAYKCPELVRRLRDRGAEVRVVMTHAAKAFITPLTLQAVSGHPVSDDLLDPPPRPPWATSNSANGRIW